MKYGYARVSTDDQPPALLRRLKPLQETLIAWTGWAAASAT
jgi:DNA invertase Pin-like site-specific DNA recombinase